jgi:3-hydroxyisobutyrate dehydrogenase-like beta-hydroxyacid dehydrogenase
MHTTHAMPGLIARLCNTLVVAASMAAVSESLALGKRLGVDPTVLTEVCAAVQVLGSTRACGTGGVWGVGWRYRSRGVAG